MDEAAAIQHTEHPPATVTYEFINPSDKILFDAPDDECAALTALLVGGGQCGAKRVDTGERVIGLALFGGDGGFAERYGRDLDAALDARVAEAVAAAHTFRLASGRRTSLNDWCAFAHNIRRAGDPAAEGHAETGGAHDG